MDEAGTACGSIDGELTPFGHRLQARVYFADTDFSGVVYHARYLEFLERGRSDFLRLSGVHHTELLEGAQHGGRLVWVVRRMALEFRAAATIDDILTIETRVLGLTGARIVMAQRILREETLLIEARVEAAVIDGKGRPRRFPAEWIGAFSPR